MKRAKRVEMTSRQLLTRNPSEALQNRNNHLLDSCKMLLGTLRNSAQQDPNELVAAAVEGKDAFTAQIARQWIMSDLAKQGKLDAQGRPTNKHGAVTVDLRRRHGVYSR
jgi:hypothetical protein